MNSDRHSLRAGYSHRTGRYSVNWSVVSALAAALVAIPQIASAQTLLESSRFAAGLIRPLDSRSETTRALGRAGRVDPFAPLNVTTPPDESVANQSNSRQPVVRQLPTRPGTRVVPPTTPGTTPPGQVAVQPSEPVDPEVFIDPAEFARGVQVSGVITIGSESYALLSADNTLRDVVQTGEFYETAKVTNVSQFGRSVSLTEGGESVVANVPQ